MRVAHAPGELERKPRAVAIGTFDGVHRGHRAVLDATLAAGGVPTAVTFHPHPRVVLGYQVDLLCTIERRLELLAAAGIEETLVVEFTPEIATLEPAAFVREYLEALGAEVVVAGEGFRFGRLSGGDLDTIRSLGLAARAVPIIDGVSSTHIRTLAHAGDVDVAAGLLGRPFELDGIVVTGDQRGGTLGFPTANLRVAPELLVPEFGIYAGAVGDRRAAVSIGVNPHYGGSERRIEAFLLDWEGDLYGSRLGARALEAPARRAGVRQRGRPDRADRAGRGRDPRGRAPGLVETETGEPAAERGRSPGAGSRTGRRRRRPRRSRTSADRSRRAADSTPGWYETTRPRPSTRTDKRARRVRVVAREADEVAGGELDGRRDNAATRRSPRSNHAASTSRSACVP